MTRAEKALEAAVRLAEAQAEVHRVQIQIKELTAYDPETGDGIDLGPLWEAFKERVEEDSGYGIFSRPLEDWEIEERLADRPYCLEMLRLIRARRVARRRAARHKSALSTIGRAELRRRETGHG